MPPQKKYATPPPLETGFRIFVRAAYPARYNFAVANYNAVMGSQRSSMFGDSLMLFRSVVAVFWIMSMAFAALALIEGSFVIGTVIVSILYILISIYNFHVYIKNRSLLNSTRLLRAKYAGPNGLDYEWVSVPLDSRSANERLAAVDQSALDNVRREYSGSGQSEIECMVYTKRYADTYPGFPKELLLHLIAFILPLPVGIFLATV